MPVDVVGYPVNENENHSHPQQINNPLGYFS